MKSVRKQNRLSKALSPSLGLVLRIFSTTVPSRAENVTFTYDSLDRLVRVEYEGNAVTKYTYDAAGNRTSHVVRSIVPVPFMISLANVTNAASRRKAVT